jgi:hypothetical protein
MTPYDELTAWTLLHGDATFIHQYAVDAHTAQVADQDTKPIGLAMALIGLYLRVEHAWTGRSIQLAHMRLARTKREWPAFVLPEERGSMHEEDVISAEDREAALDAWAACVWGAYADANRATVDALVREGGIALRVAE